MAQFKTDLTLAELEVLITNSGLNQGLSYYVTDKDWLLYAVSVNTLKPVSGSLHIFNGETLPTGIEPDVLFIDTGIVDLTSLGFTLPVTGIEGYIPFKFQAQPINNALAGNILLFDTDDTVLLNISDSITTGISSSTESTGYNGKDGLNYKNNDYKISVDGETTATESRFLIEFHRSEFSYPIPAPHIVSAETDRNTIIVHTDCLMNIPPEALPDISVKINDNTVSVLSSSAYYTDKKFDIELDTILYGDVITLSITSGNIKNTWGGLLEAVVDYPVVNNVPES